MKRLKTMKRLNDMKKRTLEIPKFLNRLLQIRNEVCHKKKLFVLLTQTRSITKE